MIWHIVRFEMGSLDETVRVELEDELGALARINVVAWLRVARDIDEPSATGLITGFQDADALEAYRTHPDHVPVLEKVRSLGIVATRLDIATEDDANDLP